MTVRTKLRSVLAPQPPAPPPVHEDAARALGEIFVRLGRLDPLGLERIIRAHKQEGGAFAAAAARLGLLRPEEVRAGVAIQRGYLAPEPSSLALPKSLVVCGRPNGPHAEAFRGLRTRLMTSAAEHLSLFAVVGAGAASRTDHVAANLAAAFALLRRRVLLIDADLGAARTSRIFARTASPGLAEVLRGECGLGEAIVPSSVLNLSVLGAGRRRDDAHELLSSDAFASTLSGARASYDMTIVVSATAGASADAELTLAATRAAIVVARRDFARAFELERAHATLRRVGAVTLGAVMTK